MLILAYTYNQYNIYSNKKYLPVKFITARIRTITGLTKTGTLWTLQLASPLTVDSSRASPD